MSETNSKFDGLFKVLTPDIPQKGDLYLASYGIFPDVRPMIVADVSDSCFSATNFLSRGRVVHYYAHSSGILVKKSDRGFELYATQGFIDELNGRRETGHIEEMVSALDEQPY